MPRFRKYDIEYHSERFNGRKVAINVKAYNFPSSDDVVERFHCSEKTAEKAIEWAWESQVEMFWEDAQTEADYILKPHFGHVKVYSEGRSGGWLTVEHNSNALAYEYYVDQSWDAIDVATWGRFVKCIKSDVEYLSSKEQVMELIEMNEWANELKELEEVF